MNMKTTPQDVKHHNNDVLLNSRFLDILHGIQSSYVTDEFRKKMHPLKSTKEFANRVIQLLTGHTIRSNAPILLIDALEIYGEVKISGKLLSGMPIYSIPEKVEFNFRNHKPDDSKLKITLSIINKKFKYNISTSQGFENYCSRHLDTQKGVLEISISNKIENSATIHAHIEEIRNTDHTIESQLDIHIKKEKQTVYAWAEYKNIAYIAYHDILPKHFTDRLITNRLNLNIPMISHGINRLTTNTLKSLVDNTQHPTLEKEKFEILSKTLHYLSEWVVSDADIKDETKYNEITTNTADINRHLEKLKSINTVKPSKSPEAINSYIAVIEYKKLTSTAYERILLDAAVMYTKRIKGSEILEYIKDAL